MSKYTTAKRAIRDLLKTAGAGRTHILKGNQCFVITAERPRTALTWLKATCYPCIIFPMSSVNLEYRCNMHNAF